MMEPLATQPYVKIERKVSSIEQQDIEHEREINLYPDRMTTKYRTFFIEEVYDVSYRMFHKNSGLLYLYTSKGVFSYIIKSSPKQFVTVFRSL